MISIVLFAGQTSQLNDPGGPGACWQWTGRVRDLSGEQGRHDGLPLQPHGPLQALLRQDDQTCKVRWPDHHTFSLYSPVRRLTISHRSIKTRPLYF